MIRILNVVLFLIFLAGILPHINAQTAQVNIAGTWQGVLKISTVQLRIVFNVTYNEEGELSATLDSPDQSAYGIPVDTVTLNDKQISFISNAVVGRYDGELSEDPSEIKGIWKQGGSEFPLDLNKTDKVEKPHRPQHPEKPFPYNEEEVFYDNKDAGITLAGTFTYPKEGDKFPAVILISGSGPQDRDETVFNHKPFLVISDYLTRNGIAVLRFDDRGVGESSGSFAAATTEDFVTDVIAGIEFLKARPEIDINNIGLIGHSEGGIIAPMAAVQRDDAAFIILLAGTGLPGEEILYMQSRLISELSGEEPEKIDRSIELMRQIYSSAKSDKDSVVSVMKIRKDFYAFFESLSEQDKKEVGDPELYIQNRIINVVMSPWFRLFLTLDPAEYLKQINIPVLAIIGEKDVQVPPKENLEAIRKALNEAGNENYALLEMPGLNHLFQKAETGNITEYALIEETFSEEVLKIISDWILKTIN